MADTLLPADPARIGLENDAVMAAGTSTRGRARYGPRTEDARARSVDGDGTARPTVSGTSRKAPTMTAQLTSSLDRLVQDPAVQVVDVSKTYGRGQNAVHALRAVTAAFNPGTFTAVM